MVDTVEKKPKVLSWRRCEIVCDVDKLKVDIQQTCMKYDTIKDWAYINHDKDDTRPHYHIQLFFDYPVDMYKVANWFQVPINFIEKIKSKKRGNALLYLIHGHEADKFKHQYSPEEVIANFDWKTEVDAEKLIGNFAEYSYAKQIAFVESIKDSRERASNSSLLERLWKQHCKFLSLTAHRDLQVIFIEGVTGAGKTYYAQKFCKAAKRDYFVSSSSNDPFDGYAGQQAVILDDLRDSSFEKLEDLLKILDNNTGSSVRSRYVNIVLCCDLIIVTATVPLCEWYPSYKDNKFDTLQQLYRRFGNYITITREEIKVYSEIDSQGRPTGIAQCFRNEVAQLEKKAKALVSVSDVFGEICDPVATPFDIDDGDMPF